MTPQRRSPLYSTALVIIAALLSVSVTACNTMEGAGKDIKSGGKAIEDTAKDAKN